VFDTVIRNAKIIDGTGNPWYSGEVGIKDGKIAAIGRKIEGRADKEIDASGMVVSPGFIDIHSHSDFMIILDPRAQSKVQQGVTTELNGQCGGWAAPLHGESLKQAEEMLEEYDACDKITWSGMDGYFACLEATKPAINQAILVGHGTVRAAVFGYDQREPSSQELREMKVLIREAMKAGAFGMSTGLYYAPGSYSKTDEVTELCKVVAELGGIHASHIRDETDYSIGLIAAVQEVIDISEGSGVSTEIAHLKALGPRQWGKGPRLLEMIEDARAQGLDVTADQYPYPASGSSITGALLPRWAQEGGREGTLAKLADKATRAKMFEQMCENLDRRGGANRLLVSVYSPDRTLQGKTLQQVADERGEHPIETALRLLEKSDASFVSFVIDEGDVEAIMKHPSVMVGTDGYALATDGIVSSGHPHPRSFATYPRILSHYVREKHVLRLEDAVRKMTSCPAAKIGLYDRGVLKPGAWADIVVFDPCTVRDAATFADPKQYPTGIRCVLVNGTAVVKDGVHQDVFPGHVLRKKC
jgi:N-acyl-D-amino-acid deacylase